jgi:hypothetical protein
MVKHTKKELEGLSKEVRTYYTKVKNESGEKK